MGRDRPSLRGRGGHDGLLVPAGARWGTGAGRRPRARVPPGLARRRVRRRLGVLHPVGLPDHVARPGRARPHRPPRRPGVLRPARVRRLLPASVACLAAVVLWPGPACSTASSSCAATSGRRSPRSTTGSPCRAAQTYADLVAGGEDVRSPLDHYWSLAIEEQFYWVWPLAMVLVLRAGRRRRVLVVGALTVAAAMVAPLIAAVWGADAAYWATPARLAEILVGALLAVVLHARRSPRTLPRPIAWLGVIGIGAIAWAALTWPAAGGPAYEGWLPLFALATAGLVARSAGPLAAASPALPAPARRPRRDQLRRLPVPLAGLRRARRGAHGPPGRRALRGPHRRDAAPRRRVVPPARAPDPHRRAASAGVRRTGRPARRSPSWSSSSRWTRRRTGRSRTTRRPQRRSPRSTRSSSCRAADDDDGDDDRPAPPPPRPRRPRPPSNRRATTTTVAPTTTVDPYGRPAVARGASRPVRIVVTGDSTAMATGDGLLSWAESHPDVARGRGGRIARAAGSSAAAASPIDEDAPCAAGCAELLDEELAEGTRQPAARRRRRHGHGPRHREPGVGRGGGAAPADRRTLRRAPDRRLRRGDAVSRPRASLACCGCWPSRPSTPVLPLVDPAQHDAYAAAIAEVVARHPGRAAVVDLRGWLARQPEIPERPDGLHWSADGATRLANDYLGPVVVAATVT